MFVIWNLLVRYPRMYSTPPPPEDEDEEAEDDTIVQLLQLPDALTFGSLIALSLTLPLKMDDHLPGWSWNKTLSPLYFCFFAPLLSLLILIPLIGWKPIRYGMIKPFSTWAWWMDFVTYTIAGPFWVYLLSLHLDGKTDTERLPWKVVWIPLLLINGVSALTNIVFFNCLELIKDLAISLPFNTLVIAKLSETTRIDSWWHVMLGVFIATGFMPFYLACLPNPRTSRLFIMCGAVIVAIPLLVFQIHATQKLEWEEIHNKKSDVHNSWKVIFSPVYFVETIMFCPICYAVMCTVAYNMKRERKKRKAIEEAAEAERQALMENAQQNGNIGFAGINIPNAIVSQAAQAVEGANGSSGSLLGNDVHFRENAVARAERGMSAAVEKFGEKAAPDNRIQREAAKRAASHAIANAKENARR